MKTLIADDERPVRIAISKLGQWGKYHLEQPVQVENGQEALLAMYELKPSIVFVDIQMPVMNGLDFLEKASVEFPGTVYIIVSGYDEFSYAQKAIHYGAIDYLLKPIEEDKLNAAIEKAVRMLCPDFPGNSQMQDASDIKAEEVIEIIKEKIDHEYSENIRISDFSAKYFFSREYLSKLFKTRYGIGIYEYLQKVRMERAAALLRDPDIKILDISSRIGYTDNNYFSKAFRNYYNLTPTEFRKQKE